MKTVKLFWIEAGDPFAPVGTKTLVRFHCDAIFDGGWDFLRIPELESWNSRVRFVAVDDDNVHRQYRMVSRTQLERV